MTNIVESKPRPRTQGGVPGTRIPQAMTQERFNSELFLTTSQVAELLGVHPSTVKRWCNEGDLTFDKTEGGHRRIHLNDALELAKDRDIVTFLQPFEPYEGHVWSAVNEVVDGAGYDRVHSLAMGWLMRGQTARLSQLFLELGRHPDIPFPGFCDQGIAGFMRQVGDAWRSGQLRVGEEHMLTETLVEVLIRLRSEGARGLGPNGSGNGSSGGNGVNGSNGSKGDQGTGRGPFGRRGEAGPRRAVVGSMEGDRHSLAPHCIRLELERMGWEVVFLGADVPVEDFAAIQKARGAGLVAVSFAPPSTGADMKRCIRILSEFHDPAHPFAVAMGGIPMDSVDLTDLDPPFTELSIFNSIAGFHEALVAGFASPATR